MLSGFETYAIIISLFSLIFLLLLLKIKGIFEWKISLLKRLEKINEKSQDTTNLKEKKAYEYVYLECKKIYKKNYYSNFEIINLLDFVNEISRIYNPESKKPFLEISIGDFLYFSNLAAIRIEKILDRKILKLIYGIRLKNLFFSFNIYNIFLKNKVLKAFFIIWKNYSLFSIVLWFNPFGLLIFLSSSLLRMSILRFLMSDFFLFAGEYAIKAYSSEKQGTYSFDKKNYKYNYSQKNVLFQNIALKKIKKDFLVKTFFWGSLPEKESFKKAFFDSVFVISKHYFKESENPLMEAKAGLVLERTAHWLKILSDLSNRRIVKYFFKIRLSSFFSVYSLHKKYLPELLKDDRKILGKTIKIASYSRMLFKVLQKPSPMGFAAWAGTEYGKNFLVFFILKFSYEKMILEIDYVYKNSQ
jgi:hypothetical protein